MDWSRPITLTTGAGTITFNVPSSLGMFENDPSACGGLSGGGPIRNPKDQRSQTDGAVKHPYRRDGRPIAMGGRFRPAGALDPQYYGDRQDMKDALAAALDSILNSAGTLSWTPAGDGTNSRSIAVFYEVDLETPWETPLVQRYVFGLYAPDPVIT